jgi:two-component sensor histidine kinase
MPRDVTDMIIRRRRSSFVSVAEAAILMIPGGTTSSHAWLTAIERKLCAVRRQPSAILATAAALILAATLARIALGPLLDNSTPFVTYFPVVLIIGFLGGYGAGLLSVALTAVIAAYVFMPPAMEFSLTPAALAATVTYVFSGGLMATAGAALGATVEKLSAERQRAEAYLAQSQDNELRVERINAELRHRIKNLFSVVDGLMKQTAAHTTDSRALAAAVSDRIHAMSRALDLLASNNFEATDFETVIDRVMQGLIPPGPHRFDRAGTQALCSAETATTFALALHELATNCIKYGAWSDEEGRVSLHWQVGTDDTERSHVDMVWQEMNGPKTIAPETNGFGLKLLQRLLPNGRLQLAFEEDGLVAVMRMPCQHKSGIGRRPDDDIAWFEVRPDSGPDSQVEEKPSAVRSVAPPWTTPPTLQEHS